MYPAPFSSSLFRKRLLKWNKERNMREMPWKGEKNPYRIWLSEIILQQTRVEQGLGYYNAFIHQYPDIHSLATASDQEVFKLWEGLGYYSRCRNLLATARFINDDLGGRFPDNYEAILGLKGIGPYTAAAIASFAFNLPHAVVDGNVFRVIARVFGIVTATDSTAGKKEFSSLAVELLDPDKPGIYNQAIMDFGATICKPLAPLCQTCPLADRCVAYQTDKVADFPVKEKKTSIRSRYFHFVILRYKNGWAVRQRESKDVWRGLFEFPLIESEKPLAQLELLQRVRDEKWIKENHYAVQSFIKGTKQQLSHQLIHGSFLELLLFQKPSLPGDFQWVSTADLDKLAFPRLLRKFIETKSK